MKPHVFMFLYLISTAGYAQRPSLSSNIAAQKAYILANQHLNNSLYDKAIVELKIAIGADSQFVAAYQQLGDIYRRLKDYKKAKNSYYKVLRIDPDFHQVTYFALAESELKTGDYANALIHFKQYASFPELREESRIKTAKYIADCEFSLKAIRKPVVFRSQNLGREINTPESEYLPAVTADEQTIIFTRRIKNNEDFFKSVKLDGKWTEAKPLDGPINTLEFNEGAQCVSPDGNYLFFTGCNRPDGLGRCDIYISRWENGEWSIPFNIGGPVNTSGWESQPSISADGRTLYFVSDRPGGQGANDVWKSDLGAEGVWSSPVNLGADINTPYDEHSPFIHPDNETLYFSSDGWPGFGNKDLFMSRKKKSDTSGWEKPKNLGYPINTFAEESGLNVSANGKVAYFASSHKPGSEDLDLYSFELPGDVRPLPVTYVKGKVTDILNNQPISAKIEIIDLNTGLPTYDDVSDRSDGEFLAILKPGESYALNVSKEGYLFYSQNFSPGSQHIQTPYLIEVALQHIQPGGMVILNNIFFDTNQFDLLPESTTELSRLVLFLQQNPSIDIEIGGHTDDIGTEESNILLSEARAKSVYDYLISNEIQSSRLTFKGYGETKPLNDNLSEENRQINRRTEFKIVNKEKRE